MFTALLVYVDDIIIVSNDEVAVERLKESLDARFKLKDFGPLRFFLSLNIARFERWIFVSQRPYVLQLLYDTGYLGKKPVSTPIEANIKLSQDDGELLEDPSLFRRMIGQLLYMNIHDLIYHILSIDLASS